MNSFFYDWMIIFENSPNIRIPEAYKSRASNDPILLGGLAQDEVSVVRLVPNPSKWHNQMAFKWFILMVVILTTEASPGIPSSK